MSDTLSKNEMPTDPVSGKPPAGSVPSVADLDYQVKYQRAFEAVLWSMPAIGIYGFHRGSAGIGAGPNVILAYSKPSKPNNESLTANNQTPYIASQTDLRPGPVVLEVPPASDKASLYSQIVDHWQITIADIGPSGVDAGKGGKILLTPPGYAEQVPAEYVEVKSQSYRVAFAFRSVPGIEMGSSGITFRVRWWIDNYRERSRNLDQVHTALQVAFDRAGIPFASTTQNVKLQADLETVRRVAATSKKRGGTHPGGETNA